MQKVFVLTAEHFNVPGMICKVFASRNSAELEAMSLVNIMLDDTGNEIEEHPGSASLDNWKARMTWLQEYHDDQYCYVDIEEKDLLA